MAVNYFTSDTEKWIKEYVNCKNDRKRNAIFNDHLYLPLKHLVDSMFHNSGSLKFYHIEEEEAKSSCLAYVVGVLDKFDPTKGSKAFSYISICAKNYYIFINTKGTKLHSVEEDFNNVNENTLYVEETSTVPSEKIDVIVNYWNKNIKKVFKNHQRITIAYAVIELLKRNEEYDKIGKRTIFAYLKKMTGCKSDQIGKVIKTMNTANKKILNNYYKNGQL